MKDNVGGKHLAKIVKMADPIIDRSPAQKLARVQQMRRELLELGYSVVRTKWLHSVERLSIMEAAE
jgi:hypothetical protein